MPRILPALAAVLLVAAPAAAQTDRPWDGPAAGGSWGTAANWAGDVLPASVERAVFGAAITTAATVTLDGDRTVGGVSTAGATGPVTIAAGTGGTLTLSGQLSGGTSLLQAEGSDLSVTAPVAFGGASLQMSAAAGRTLSVAGLQVTVPTPQAGPNPAIVGFGQGAVRLGADGLTVTGSSTTSFLTLGGTFQLSASQTWAVTGTGVQVQAALDLGAAGQTLTIRPASPGGPVAGVGFLGQLTGAGGLTLAPASADPGAGLAVISTQTNTANTASGPLAVSGGTLQLTGTAAWAGTSVGVSGGQLLIGTPPFSNAPVFAALPPTTTLSLTGTGAYNLGQPDPATGSLANATPRPHFQQYATITHGSSGAFNTGAAPGSEGIVVTGTFTHSGSGPLTVTAGGRVRANTLALPAGGGTVTVVGGAAGDPLSRLGVGDGGLTITGRTITLAGNADRPAILELLGAAGTGAITSTGTSAIVSTGPVVNGQASGGVGLGNDPARPFVVTSGTLTVSADLGGGGLVKRGAGALVLNGANVDPFPTTRLEAGRLVLGNAAALGTASAGTGSGGRLALAGGTVSTAGGPGGAGVSVTAGRLQYAPSAANASATLELGTGAHVLRFFDFESGPPLALTVTGWQGPGSLPGTAGRIVFDQPFGLGNYLSQITFQGYDPGATLIPFAGGGFELVPVPEPAAVLGLAAAGLGTVRLRRRILAG